MKKKRNKLIRVLILTLLLQIVPQCMRELDIDLTNAVSIDINDDIEDYLVGEIVVAADQDYGSLFSTDPEIISRINYACKNYGPGAYLSKTKKACRCHSKRVNHVNSPSTCDCLRYVSINGSRVDLQAVQCYGYAMYMQMCILGTTQFKSSGSFTYLYGNGNKAMTALEMERFFVEHASQIHPGTHMRTRYGQHSIVIMAVDYENGKITYIDCNAVGNCQISNFRTLTWAEFAKKFSTINYLAVYKNYYKLYSGAPDADKIAQIQNKLPKPTATKKPNTPTPTPSPAEYSIGLYEIVAKPHLNLREDTYTSSKKISELPNGMQVEIFDFTYNKGGHHWGLIDTEEGSGWSSMGYLKLIQAYTPTPTPTYAPADFDSGTYQVTAKNLMVRASQTTTSESLGKISNGTLVSMMVFVIGDNDTKWGYVSIDDSKLQGWVSMDYMQIVPTETPAPTLTPTNTPTPTATEVPTLAPSQIPTDVSPTGVPGPTEIPENHKSGSSGKTIMMIAIILSCIAVEGVLFVFLRNKRNRKWVKDTGKRVGKQVEKKVKGRFKKKE